MSFLWARSLLLLGLIPLIIALYAWLLNRRRRFTVRYSSLSLVRAAASHQSRWKRHLPFALFLLALTSLVFALGRPVATVTIPSNKATIIPAGGCQGCGPVFHPYTNVWQAGGHRRVRGVC